MSEVLVYNQFPVLYENEKITIFKNSSDEIFIQTKKDPVVQIRVRHVVDHLIVTAGNGMGIMTPDSVHGLPAFRVRHP